MYATCCLQKKIFNDGNVLATQYAVTKRSNCKKKCAAPKMAILKKMQIQGGSQEMDLMVGQWQNF